MSNTFSPFPAVVIARAPENYRGETHNGLIWRLSTDQLPRRAAALAVVSVEGDVTVLDPTTVLSDAVIEQARQWLCDERNVASPTDAAAAILAAASAATDDDLHRYALALVLRVPTGLITPTVASWSAQRPDLLGDTRRCYDLMATDLDAAAAIAATLPAWAKYLLMWSDRQQLAKETLARLTISA